MTKYFYNEYMWIILFLFGPSFALDDQVCNGKTYVFEVNNYKNHEKEIKDSGILRRSVTNLSKSQQQQSQINFDLFNKKLFFDFNKDYSDDKISHKYISSNCDFGDNKQIGKLDNSKFKRLYNKIVIYETEDISAKNCNGVILNEHWILTAAHCGIRGKWVTANNVRQKVLRHIVHPKFIEKDNSPMNLDYDMQLLRLDNGLPLISPTIGIKIGSKRDYLPEEDVTAAGYIFGKNDVPVFLDAEMLSKEDCYRNIKNSESNDKKMCIEYNDDSIECSAICNSDSNVFVFHHNRLIGMRSFGFGCDSPNYVSVFTDIILDKPWIIFHTKLARVFGSRLL